MNVLEAINDRYSCRAFKPAPVSGETIVKIMEAARRTPSWANTQPWEVFVAGGEKLESLRQAYLKNFGEGVNISPDIPTPKEWPDAMQQRMAEVGKKRFELLGIDRGDKEARQKLAERNYRFFDAPAVIYLCMDSKLTSWSMYDIGAFGQSIMLAAKEYGLDTITAIMLAGYPDLIRKELRIPEDLSIAIGIALGYADEENLETQFQSPRRSTEEVVTLKGF